MTAELSNMLRQYESELELKCDMKCPRRATRTVTVHRIDTCKDADMPPTGNKTYVLCDYHADDVARRIRVSVQNMFGTLPPQASWLECTSCGLIIRTLADVLDSQRCAA